MNSDPVAILPAVLGYVNHRHFQTVIDKARTACFNSGQRVDDHFVGINDMSKSARERSARRSP